jgi:hypothetical protein
MLDSGRAAESAGSAPVHAPTATHLRLCASDQPMEARETGASISGNRANFYQPKSPNISKVARMTATPTVHAGRTPRHDLDSGFSDSAMDRFSVVDISNAPFTLKLGQRATQSNASRKEAKKLNMGPGFLEKMAEWSDKPGSVPVRRQANVIYLGRRLPAASCSLPESSFADRTTGGGDHILSAWPCSGWGLPSRASHLARW